MTLQRLSWSTQRKETDRKSGHPTLWSLYQQVISLISGRKARRAKEESRVYTRSQGKEAGARPSCICRVQYGRQGARGPGQWSSLLFLKYMAVSRVCTAQGQRTPHPLSCSVVLHEAVQMACHRGEEAAGCPGWVDTPQSPKAWEHLPAEI